MPKDRPPTCGLSESTNAWPTLPTPGGSPVPRANTTSTSGHGSAAAEGMSVGPLASANVIATATPRTRVTWCARIAQCWHTADKSVGPADAGSSPAWPILAPLRGFEEYVVERDGAQVPRPDDVDEPRVDVRDRQVIEMTDNDGLRGEVLIGHLDDVILGDQGGIRQRTRP